MPEKDPAEYYYAECLKKLSDVNRKDAIRADAFQIKPVINAFILGINKAVSALVAAEKAKGTRGDLIVTIVVGGLAFVLAHAFNNVVRKLEPGMDKEQFWTTFEVMYDTAVRDIDLPPENRTS